MNSKWNVMTPFLFPGWRSRKERIMKKKLVSSLLVLSMAATLFSGCGSGKETDTSGEAQTTGEGTETKETGEGGNYEEKKVLRVAMECAYAPFNWTQETEDVPNGDKAVKIANSDGYAWGYDVKTAQMLADALGWELEIYKTEWSAIVMGLDANDYDCIIGGMCYSEERDETLDFTTPYYLRDVVLTVKDDGPYADVTDVSEFDGKNPTVTTQLGTNFPNYYPLIPTAVEGTQYETTSEVFMAVKSGTADISVIDYPTSKSAVGTMSGLKILDIDLPCPEANSNDVCIAVREGDTELKELLQGALEECGWTTDNKDKFDAQMDEMIEVQPSSN